MDRRRDDEEVEASEDGSFWELVDAVIEARKSSPLEPSVPDPTMSPRLDRWSINWMGMDENWGLVKIEAPNPWYGRSAVVQDLRSKNRYREHSNPNCELTLYKPELRAEMFPDHRLFRCKCGWFGWLIPKED